MRGKHWCGVLAILAGISLADDLVPSCGREIDSANPMDLPEVFLDTNHKAIAGHLHSEDGSVWLFPDWNEPILVATGTPPRLVPDVKHLGNALLFTNVRLY